MYLLTYLLTYYLLQLTQGVAGGVQLEGISCCHNCSGRLENVTVPSQVTLNVIVFCNHIVIVLHTTYCK